LSSLKLASNLTPGLIRSVDLTNASVVLIRPGLKFGQVALYRRYLVSVRNDARITRIKRHPF